VSLSLARHLARLIAEDGPQPISVMMELALAHPREGYYAARARLGADGDFLTAPETSQMFGEILGVFALQTWLDLGSPGEWQLIELGPGRGTLAVDLARTLKIRLQALEKAHFHFIETSPVLRAEQHSRLGASGLRAHWHDALARVPDGPFMLFANEFFDALPIRQFLHRGSHWFERRIARSHDCPDKFEFVLAPSGFPVETEIPGARAAPENQIVEISAAARGAGREIGERLTRVPGRALILDYGYSGAGHGDTLQAVARHTKVQPLATLGEADLSAHVDFAAIAREAAGAGARTFGPVSQGSFLERLGIAARYAALAAHATQDERASLAYQLQRLTGPDMMGELFRVLALSSPDLGIPPGILSSDG
jgi:NADH dehydrogenase [ubiquinone] 1 alpha subcomplex assembly factor 7